MPPGIQSNIEDPFPGLRPFEPEESHLFFGREGHAEALLDRLEDSRFVAVVGTSGSGKSSLVKAGLFPALYGGTIAAAGSSWKIAEFRPAGDPIGELAGALSSPGVLSQDGTQESPERLVVETIIRRSSIGLVEAVECFLPGTGSNVLAGADQFEGTIDEAKGARGMKRPNLLVFVDQFEELIRLQKPGLAAKEDAALFVKLLLEAIKQKSLPIYVLFTMRSEYLGHCSRFYGLPEALNDNQYLVPRLTRDQFREAIVGPIGVCGAKIEPRLVDRLLNDLGRPEQVPKDGGDEPDRLPLLQHALMRAWDYWRTHQPPNGPARPLDIEDYDNKDVGTISKALSNHATLAYQELDEPSGKRQKIAKKLFQAITEKTPNQPESRRPTSLAEICGIAGAEQSEVIDVIDHFRAKGRAFLLPPYEKKLTSDSMIDISHESLIRQWDTLAGWVDDEAKSREAFKRIVDAARQFEDGAANEWSDPQLKIHLDWWEKEKPNSAWAQRYFPNTDAARGHRGAFESAEDFLRKSREKRDEALKAKENAVRRERRRLYLLAGISTGIAVILSLLFLVGWITYTKALATTFELKSQGVSSTSLEENILMEVTARNLDPSTYNEVHLREAIDLLPTVVGTVGISDLTKLKPALAVALSADESYMASAGADGLGRRFNLKTKTEESSYSECAPLAGGQPVADPTSGYIAVAAVFDRDGRHVAVGCADGTVSVFDVTTGTGKGIFQLRQGSVTTLAFSPDDYYVAVGSSGGTVLVHRSGLTREPVSVLTTVPGDSVCPPSLSAHPDEGTGELPPLPSPHQAVMALAFSPDSRLFAAAWVDGTAQVFMAEGVQPVGVPMKHPSPVPVWAVAFYPKNYDCLATASDDNFARLWNWKTGSKVKEIPHKGSVRTLAFSPNGEDLATGSADGMAHVWHLVTNADAARLPNNLSDGAKPITAVAFNPVGHQLATGSSDGTTRVWDTISETELARLTHPGAVTAVTFSPNGSHAAMGGADGKAEVFEFGTGTWHVVPSQYAPIRAVDFSADGQWVWMGTTDGNVKVWKVGNEPKVNPGANADWGQKVDLSIPNGSTRPSTRNRTQNSLGTFTVMGLSADGLHFVTGSESGTARVYDIEADTRNNPKPFSVVNIDNEGNWTRTTEEADGRWATTIQDKNSRVLAPEAGNSPGTAHTVTLQEAVTAVSLNSDGTFVAIATGSQNPDRSVKAGKVEFCDLRKNRDRVCKSRRYDRQVNSLAFSPDSKYLAIGSVTWDNKGMPTDGRVEIFDTANPEQPIWYQAPWGDKDSVNTVVFSPHNAYLVVSGEVKKQKEGEGNGKLAIYDITKHVMLTTRSIELGPTVVVFSPDSRYVATGDVKGRTHTFEVGSWKETSEQEQGMLVGLAFRTNDKTESKTKEFQLISAELDSAEPRVLMIRNQGTIEDPAVRACRLVTRNLSKKQWQEDAGWWAAMYERACPNRDWPDDCWHLRHLTCF